MEIKKYCQNYYFVILLCFAILSSMDGGIENSFISKTYTSISSLPSVLEPYSLDKVNFIGSKFFQTTPSCPPVTIESTITACSFLILPWGQQVTSSGDYSKLYVSYCAGDSTVIFHVTINPDYSNVVYVDACQSYTLPWGSVVVNNGVYSHHYTTQYGCDSLLIYNVNFPAITRDTNYAAGCDSVEIVFHGSPKKFYTSQIYPDTIINLGVCSSITFWDIKVNSSYSGRDTIRSCEPILHPQLGLLNDTIQLTYTHQSIHYCDSTVIYQIYIADQNITEIGPLYGCDSLIIPDLDTIYTSGLHTYIFNAANGCDSTVHYNVGIHQSTSSNLTIESCNQYSLNGKVYTVSGSYIDTTTNGEGCAHYINLTLTINQPPPKPVIAVNHPNCNQLGNINVTNPSTYLYISKLENGSYVQTNQLNNLSMGQYAVNTQSLNLCYSDTTFIELILQPNLRWYIDMDGDGYGHSATYQDTCDQPVGFVGNNRDIDDQNPNINLLLSIGNMVFEDIDNNGIYDPDDPLINNVKINLYKYDLTNNIVLVDCTFTDSIGLYLFDTLSEGHYIVMIDSTNFDIGKPLDHMVPSSSYSCGTFDGSNNGYYNPLVQNMVTSCDFLLQPDFAPWFEYPNNDNSGAIDPDNNLTIDFGFTSQLEPTLSSNNWSNPATWRGNVVPNESNFVIIPSGVTIFVDIDTAMAKKVLVMDGGHLIINENMKLTVIN